jgi:hypothetical protein
MSTVDKFLMRLRVIRPEIVKFLMGVVDSQLLRRAWRRNVSVQSDEVEECDWCMAGEVQYGEIVFDRRVRAAFISSSGRLQW